MKFSERRKFWLKIIKELSKERGWKFNDYFIFREINGFLYNATFYVSLKENAISGYVSYKPTYIDDTFWEITVLTENIKRPLSFRINAAFQVYSLNFYHFNVYINNVEKPEEEIHSLLNFIEQNIENESKRITDLDLFLKELYSDEKQNYIGIVTILINQEKYSEALSEISRFRLYEENNFQYNFKVNVEKQESEKSFLDLAEEYCFKKLSMNN